MVISMILCVVIVANFSSQTDYDIVTAYASKMNYRYIEIYNNTGGEPILCLSDYFIDSLNLLSENKNTLNITFGVDYSVRIYPREGRDVINFAKGLLIFEVAHYICYCIVLILFCVSVRNSTCVNTIAYLSFVFSLLIFLIYFVIRNDHLFVTKSSGFPKGGNYTFIASNNTSASYHFIDTIDLINKMMQVQNVTYFDIVPINYEYSNDTFYNLILCSNYMIFSIMIPVIIYMVNIRQ